MNPWLAAGLAAAALWFLRMNSSAQQQAQNAQAGTQAGAGQTSDQGGGSSFTPDSTIIPYQGGVTQPVSTVSYQPSPDGSGGDGGYGPSPTPDHPSYPGSTGQYAPSPETSQSPYSGGSSGVSSQPTHSGVQF